MGLSIRPIPVPETKSSLFNNTIQCTKINDNVTYSAHVKTCLSEFGICLNEKQVEKQINRNTSEQTWWVWRIDLEDYFNSELQQGRTR